MNQNFNAERKEVPEGHKACSCCGEVKPATHEYFHRCKTGRDGLRCDCKDCIREKHKKYDTSAAAKRWRKENPEEYRQYQREWKKKNRKKISEYNRRWRTENPEKAKYFSRRWKKNNPEKVRENAARWRKNNPEKVREYRKKSMAINPEKRRAKRHKRRARERGATGKHSAADIKTIYRRQKGRCYWCLISLNGEYHVDHRIPLARGGSNDASNLVISCPECNMKKGDKMPHEWCGRLL